MICSHNSRCKNFNSIEFDYMFICNNCDTIFNKKFKIVINCCKKRYFNRKSNIPYCKNCKKFVYVQIFSYKHSTLLNSLDFFGI